MQLFSTMARKVASSFVLCLALVAGVQQRSAAQPGSVLNTISLKNVAGETVNLGKYVKAGHPTVISFWATWCSPCKRELTNIMDLYPEWKEKYGCEVVAISVDDSRNASKVKSYVDGVRWPYEILLDPNGDMQRNLNFQTVPYTILIDAEGNIVYTHASYVEGDELILEEKLEALLKGAPVKH